jgi:hypothetical protein
MGYFQWVRNKASSIYNGAKAKASEAYSGVKSVLSTGFEVAKWVGSGLASHDFRHGFADSFAQFWQGFTRVLDLPLLVRTLLTRPETARAYAYGQGFAMLHLAPAMVYSCVLPQLDVILRESGGDTLATAVEAGAILFCIYNYVDAYADDLACGTALATASAKESAALHPENNPLMEPCAHGAVSQFGGSFNSVIYSMGYSLQLLALRKLVKQGEYLSLPLQVMVSAQGFMDYPAGAAGMCTEDRRRLYVMNKRYLAGLGVSYLTWLYVVETLVERYTGANGFFVRRALESLVGLHFIMVSILSRDKPLPGTEMGVDVLQVNRDFTDFLVMQGVKQVRQYCKGRPESDWVQGSKEMITAAWDSPILYLPRKLIPSSLQSYDKLALRKTSRLYLEMCGASLETTLRKILAMRESDGAQFLNFILPSIKGGMIEKFRMMMDPYLDRPLRDWIDYLDKVRKADFRLPDPVPVHSTGMIAKTLRLKPMARPSSPLLIEAPVDIAPAKQVEDLIPATPLVSVLVAPAPALENKEVHDRPPPPEMQAERHRPAPPARAPQTPALSKAAKLLRRRPLNSVADDELKASTLPAAGLNL